MAWRGASADNDEWNPGAGHLRQEEWPPPSMQNADLMHSVRRQWQRGSRTSSAASSQKDARSEPAKVERCESPKRRAQRVSRKSSAANGQKDARIESAESQALRVAKKTRAASLPQVERCDAVFQTDATSRGAVLQTDATSRGAVVAQDTQPMTRKRKSSVVISEQKQVIPEQKYVFPKRNMLFRNTKALFLH